MDQINERIVLNFGLRKCRYTAGRWVVSIPIDIIKNIRKDDEEEIVFEVFYTENGKIILVPKQE